jgi:hypothetical protein
MAADSGSLLLTSLGVRILVLFLVFGFLFKDRAKHGAIGSNLFIPILVLAVLALLILPALTR